MECRDPLARSEGQPAAIGTDRRHLLEQIDDAAVVQLYADGFEKLSLADKTLVWHLYLAALAGRDHRVERDGDRRTRRASPFCRPA